MGKRSRLKRATTREQRAKRHAPALEFTVEAVGTPAEPHAAVVRWLDGAGAWHEQRFPTYQAAQSHGYAALRGEL